MNLTKLFLVPNQTATKTQGRLHIFTAVCFCFRDNRLSDEWGFGPIGHFLTIGFEIMGCWNNGQSPLERTLALLLKLNTSSEDNT